jgi:DNA polymerase-1
LIRMGSIPIHTHLLGDNMHVFDIESNGLLDTITKVHCINVIDRTTGREYRYTDHEFYQDLDGSVTNIKCPRDGHIKAGLQVLQNANTIAGHHIIGYDCPALEIVYPDDYNKHIDSQYRYDSKVASQLAYPDLKDKDWTRIRKGKLPADFGPRWAGSHSLYPWGIRLGGESKSDFKPGNYVDPNTGKKHTWSTIPFIQDMDEYCMQDVRANVALIEHLEAKAMSAYALDIEFEVADVICWQETIGVPFNVEAAEEFAKELYTKALELETQCRSVFPAFYVKDGQEKTFKRSMKRKAKANGGVPEWCDAGATVQNVKLVDFNPGSRRHISLCLQKKYDWEPSEFTPKGQVKIDEEILGTLPFPEARQIAEYMTVQKRLSQLAEGKQAWLKAVKDGRIYGRVNQLGCVTGRMSHWGPNLGQVPANDSDYGPECRALFVAEDGRVIVGCDADALELRVLAHFMARFDGGAYIQVILNGRKEDGTDMHTRNQEAVGLVLRATAKTFFYAMLYGSGNFNLGTIIISEWTPEKAAKFYSAFPAGQQRQRRIARLGQKGRAALLDGMPALKALIKKVGEAAKRGHLKGIDGRIIPIRSAHAALNSLCQSAGAVIMKQALVIMFREFRGRGLDVRPLLNVHDEVQLSVLEEEAHDVGRITTEAIKQAGEDFDFRCPLAGNYDVGLHWGETH